MLVLFGVRVASLCTRAMLNSGSQEAIMHYFFMEVRALPAAADT